MIIRDDSCTGCRICFPYCPVAAIKDVADRGVARIDLDECVECGVCLRSGVCPTDSFEQNELSWPRSLRAAFSNPVSVHGSTAIPGRGTEEMKTNDVTDEYRVGMVGMGVELGRPGVATGLSEVEQVSVALAELGVTFARNNPVTYLMTDTDTGTLQTEVLGERVLSAIVEFTAPSRMIGEILSALTSIADTLGTVFSLEIITRVGSDGEVSNIDEVIGLQYRIAPNAKVNAGLGRRPVKAGESR